MIGSGQQLSAVVPAKLPVASAYLGSRDLITAVKCMRAESQANHSERNSGARPLRSPANAVCGRVSCLDFARVRMETVAETSSISFVVKHFPSLHRTRGTINTANPDLDGHELVCTTRTLVALL